MLSRIARSKTPGLTALTSRNGEIMSSCVSRIAPASRSIIMAKISMTIARHSIGVFPHPIAFAAKK